MNDGRFEVFYDGNCPLCRREIRFLQKRDRRNAIEYTDIAAPKFDPASVGVDLDTLMARIHGRRPDGELVTGVDVFRELYSAIGWHKIVAVTRWPILRNVLNVGYVAFAKLRPYLPGRHGPADESPANPPST
ncbi:MAG: DUF393 domain-containing protein [Planctomycetota bacterium]